MPLLAYCHYKTLAAHSESLNQLETLLRCARPESWQATFQVKRLRDKVEKQAYLSTEEVIGVFSGLLREGRQMGPNSQDVLQTHLEPLLETLGLSKAVIQAADAPQIRLTARR